MKPARGYWCPIGRLERFGSLRRCSAWAARVVGPARGRKRCQRWEYRQARRPAPQEAPPC